MTVWALLVGYGLVLGLLQCAEPPRRKGSTSTVARTRSHVHYRRKIAATISCDGTDAVVKVIMCRPTGTCTRDPVGSPSSKTATSGGSAVSLICTKVSVDTLIVDTSNDASPALATSTVRPATPLRFSVKNGIGSTEGPVRQSSSV